MSTPKLVKDLPKEIADLYVKRQVEQGKQDRGIHVAIGAGMSWDNTLEGHDFWLAIYNGNYSVFYERYPQTKEWEPVNGDEIEVRHTGVKEWRRGKFIGWDYGRYVVSTDCEYEAFAYARPLPTRHTVTQQQLIECYARVNNISKDQIEVK